MKWLKCKHVGNCFTFAFFDFLKNGGELYIEFWGKRIIPHFSVKRGNYIHDLEVVSFICYIILYLGEVRVRHIDTFEDCNFRRFLLLKLPYVCKEET